jgi:hypothetical protein
MVLERKLINRFENYRSRYYYSKVVSIFYLVAVLAVILKPSYDENFCSRVSRSFSTPFSRSSVYN